MFNKKLFLLMMMLLSGMAVMAMSKTANSSPRPVPERAVGLAGETAPAASTAERP